MKKNLTTLFSILILAAMALTACASVQTAPLPKISVTQTQSMTDLSLMNPETVAYDPSLTWTRIPEYRVDKWVSMQDAPATVCGTKVAMLEGDYPHLGFEVADELYNAYVKSTGLNFAHNFEAGRPVTFDMVSGDNMIKVGLVGQPALYLHQLESGSYQVACAN